MCLIVSKSEDTLAGELADARLREAKLLRRLDLLGRANAALRRVTDGLASEPDIEMFLGTALRAFVEAFGGMGGTFWWWTPEGLRLAFECRGGEILKPDRSEHPDARRPAIFGNPEIDELERRQRGGEILLRRVGEPFGWTSGAQDWLRLLGVGTLVLVPLNIGDQHLGRFSIRRREARDLAPEEYELAKALATQAATAMALTKLSNQARETSTAREREAAAQQKAEGLSRANAAIRASLDRLAEQKDPHSFLSEAIVVCARELGAAGAGIWVRNGSSEHQLIVSLEDGEVRRPPMTRHPGATPGLTANFSDRILRREEIIVDSGEALRSMAWYPVYRGYLESRGITALASIPLYIGDTWAGTIVLRHTEEPVYGEDKQELAFALANQVALALELTRLAEVAKQAAVARERERAATERAAKLAKANAALRATIESLRTTDDLDALLGNALKAIADQIDVKSATVWLYDWNASLCHLKFVLENGRVLPAQESQHPNAHSPSLMTEFDTALIQDHGTGRATPAVQPVQSNPGLTEAQRKYLLDLGCKALLSVPMTLGNEHIGTFTARLESEQYPLAEDFELIQALAGQATLAIQLQRLADMDKAAAVAREQAIAAGQRSALLERSNETLRHSLDLLADDSVIARFLGHVLRAVTEGLDVAHSTLWIFDESTGMNTLHMTCSQGQVRDAAAGCGGPPLSLPVSGWAPWLKMVASRRPLVFHDAQNHPDLVSQREWMRREGVRTLLVAPLMMGERVLGTFGIHNISRDIWTEDEINLARAMAHQATVALQLTRLAAAAQEAAVHREREASERSRYETLRRTNSLLRESLRILAGAPDLEQFLGELLKVLVQALGASEGSVWVHDAGRNLDALRVTLDRSGRLAGSAEAHPLQRLQPAIVDSDLTGAMREKRVALNHENSFHQPRFAPFLDYLRERGIQSVASVPMFLGDRYRGAVTLRFDHRRNLEIDDEQLAMAFAHQAALAVQMGELAEKARRGAVVEERNRMAQEIHDTLAQGFATIGLQLLTAEREAAAGTLQAAKEHIATARELARSNLFEARRSMRTLQSPHVPAGGLDGALRRLTEHLQLGTPARIGLTVEAALPVLPRAVEDELLGIAREALNNAIKHARPARVTVSLRASGESGVQLRVTDDGGGFDPDRATAGYGLNGMRGRAARIGAALTIVTDPGSGVDLIAVWTPAGE